MPIITKYALEYFETHTPGWTRSVTDYATLEAAEKARATWEPSKWRTRIIEERSLVIRKIVADEIPTQAAPSVPIPSGWEYD
jgi:hypothetical protein